MSTFPSEETQLLKQSLNAGVAIRTWYFRRVNNIGDLISPVAVSSVSNRATVFTSDPTETRLFAVGSILAGANSKTVVWGSGFMDPIADLPPVSLTNIYLVRGKLSHHLLRSGGHVMPEIPLGDPGYLVPSLFPTSSPFRFRLGVIPHYVDRQHLFVQNLLRKDSVILPNVHAAPEDFFRDLRSCDVVISSSLHGLIFAEALGIPNLWLKLSDRVMRTGFKYHDWFSLAREPQDEPYEPRGDEAVDELIDRAALHDMDLSCADLIESFPHERVDELSKPTIARGFISLSGCREMPLPIFVISYNRGLFLRKAIDSYRRLNKDVTIVIHDNGSDDGETLDVLDKLSAEGIKIYSNGKISTPEELNRVNDTVNDYFSTWAEPSRYVVTDCDIDLSIAHLDALEVYDEILNRYTAVDCVGPMLRIRDILTEYPLYRLVMQRHIHQFWQQRPEWIDTSFGRIASIECIKDTTFALHRAGEPFHRLKTARRVYYPYEAQHLDWYMTADEICRSPYYRTSSGCISHWSNMGSLKEKTDCLLEYDKYFYVYEEEDGSLVERVAYLTTDEQGHLEK